MTNKNKLAFVVLCAFSTGASAQFYLKGSLGNSWNRIDNFEFINPNGAPDASTPLVGGKILMTGVKDSKSSRNLGLGLGYQVPNTPFRLELRMDNRGESEASGFGSFGGNQFAQQLKYKSTSLMAFGLYDFALAKQHDLFIGFGIGKSRNQSSGLQGANRGVSNFFPSRTNQETAWSLVGGYAYSITENIKLDAELAYSRLGKVDTGVTDAGMAPVIAGNQNVGEQLKGKWTATELRLGLRYSFR